MPGLGLLLDIVIIVLLGATIFYALRLSRHLDAFRSNRSDMERLIRDLSTQIVRAQEGVTALDDVAKTSGDELRVLITKAQALTDELSLMTEAGDSMATRLETLATRNRSMVDELGQTAMNMVYPAVPKPQAPRAPEPRNAPERDEDKDDSAVASFFTIRDPDFSPSRDEPPRSARVEETDMPDSSGLETQAERDLAAAMRRRKRGE